MTENDRLARLIIAFCRVMLMNLDEATSEDILRDFMAFVRKENL